MKVMVCLKQVPHQDARLDVNRRWNLDPGRQHQVRNQFSYDTYAIEEALRLKDAGDAEVVVVSIGPDRVTQALRTALGMGADRAVHVNDEAAQWRRRTRNRQDPRGGREGRRRRRHLHRPDGG